MGGVVAHDRVGNDTEKREEKTTVTRDLRWRILVLQVIVTVVFAFSAGVCVWAHNFTHDEVTTQLTQQGITMPTAAAFSKMATADQDALRPYAGQLMTNGDQARAFAEHYIAIHLSNMGGTYEHFSGLAMAEQKTNPTQWAKDNNMALQIFRGDTLRTMLNTAWAFWFVGQIALYAGIGLAVAAVAVLLSLLYELFVAKPKTV